MMRKFIPLVVPLLLAGVPARTCRICITSLTKSKTGQASGIEPIPEVKQVIGFVYTA